MLRTDFIDDGAFFDLGGGTIVQAFLLALRTDGSTTCLLEGRELRAVAGVDGSGSGFWLITSESLTLSRRASIG